MITAFPNGVSSFGIPLPTSNRIPIKTGKFIFVDGTNGLDGNDGSSKTQAMKTITAAVAAATVDSVVLVLPGTYTEAVTVSTAGVSIIGLGASVKDVIWTSATDTKTCALSAANCEVAFIYFKPPTYTAGIPASIALSNAGYAYIHDNRFQGQTGSWNAIYSAVENSDNVIIANNDFAYMNTLTNGAAIKTVAAGGLSYSFWKIIGNTFTSCVTNIILAGARICLIQGNNFAVNGVTALGVEGAVTTMGINLSGTSSGANMVHGNYLGGTYGVSLYVVGTAGDDWAGNFNIAGITAANPS